MDHYTPMKTSLTLLFFIILTACSGKLHPLEEAPKFQRPQVVKPEDMNVEPIRTSIIETDTEVTPS